MLFDIPDQPANGFTERILSWSIYVLAFRVNRGLHMCLVPLGCFDGFIDLALQISGLWPIG